MPFQHLPKPKFHLGDVVNLISSDFAQSPECLKIQGSKWNGCTYVYDGQIGFMNQEEFVPSSHRGGIREDSIGSLLKHGSFQEGMSRTRSSQIG